MRTWSLVALALLVGFGYTPADAAAQGRGGRGGDGPSRRADMTIMERPIEAANVVWMEEMTVLEIRDALRGGMTNALILTGGVEQNGPYLPTGKHNYVLAATGEAIARRMGNTLVAPIVTLEPGNPENGRSPGSTFVSQETYRGILRDMATSLRAQGFTNVFMMGDSGGNQGAMRDVAAELNAAWQGQGGRVHYVEAYYREDIWSCAFIEQELGVVQQPADNCSATRDQYHDDYHYTTIVATTGLERIRFDQRQRAGLLSINSADLSDRERVLEHGRRLVEYRADITVRAMRELMAGG